MGRRRSRGLTAEDVARIMGTQSVQTEGKVQKGSFAVRIQSAQARQKTKKEGK